MTRGTYETMEFESWRFDRRAGCLYRRDADGAWTSVSIGSRALDILSLLLERPGVLVSRDTIMDTVWPGIAVEPNNLTVQISALRRVLDEARAGESCIQTVPGRGYRFVRHVAQSEETQSGPELVAPIADPIAPPVVPARSRRPRWPATALGGIAIAALVIIVAWHNGWFAGPLVPPRLSIAVLPFENLSGDPGQDYLAEAITDDLTTDLSHIAGAFVIARSSSYTYRGKPAKPRQVGDELGVRYMLRGSVRAIGPLLRVNAQLVSTETSDYLWTDRFDERLDDLTEDRRRLSGGSASRLASK